MSSSPKLWEAWTLSKQLRVRPSELYFIHDEFTAFCFDRAVTMFGMAVEQGIDKATEKTKTSAEAKRKAKRELDKWLREPEKKGSRKFRDPAVRG